MKDEAGASDHFNDPLDYHHTLLVLLSRPFFLSVLR